MTMSLQILSLDWHPSAHSSFIHDMFYLLFLKKTNNYENTWVFFLTLFGLSPHSFFNFMNEKVTPPPFPTFLIQLIFLVSGVHIMCDASAYPQFCRDLFYINSNICFKCLILMIKTCLLGNAS